jgi:hypothetical protein
MVLLATWYSQIVMRTDIDDKSPAVRRLKTFVRHFTSPKMSSSELAVVEWFLSGCTVLVSQDMSMSTQQQQVCRVKHGF